MTIGDLNVPNAIINLEVQLIVQNALINKLMQASSKTFPQSEIDEEVKKAQELVKNKYPELGIKF